jgi:methylenetetrahydrofolate reductase (NADPH)
VVTIAEANARRLGRMDRSGRQALVAFLSSPRYEVLPTDDIEDRVLASVPHEVTITITASPRRGIEATVDLAERLGRHGYQVVPHISARLIRDYAHLREVLARVAAIGRR